MVQIKNRDHRWVTWQTVRKRKDALAICEWFHMNWNGEPLDMRVVTIKGEGDE